MGRRKVGRRHLELVLRVLAAVAAPHLRQAVLGLREKEGGRERERDKERDKETEKHTQREREREGERGREGGKEGK